MAWIGEQAWFHAAQPGYLALLALLPLIIVWSRRSLAGLGPVRRPLAIALRCMVIGLLAFALAGFERVRRTDDQTAVFVLDTSASVPADLQRAGLRYMQRAAETMRAGRDRVGLVVCAGGASVEQLARATLGVDQVQPAPRPAETNLAGGLRLATALLPPDTARRLVLLSDGNQNTGDVLLEAEQLRAAGIAVDVLPLSYVREPEVAVEQLAAPATARLDETVNLGAVLRATRPVTGRLRLYHNDTPVDAASTGRPAGVPVELNAGPNRLVVPVLLTDAGAHRFRVEFQPDQGDQDQIAQNNVARAFTVVGGRERILLVGAPESTARPDEAESVDVLTRTLSTAGLDCEVRNAGAVALDPATLLEYSAVVLCNVSATALTGAEQAALASYVRDLGGGLVVLGGDQAFSVGGYFGTPLEDILPVETDRQKLKILSLGLVIVVDRSGSMTGEKIALAKTAARGAAQLLSGFDKVGVVAFNSAPTWIVPFGPCSDKAAIQTQLGQLGAGGGTNMYPALEQALAALMATDTNIRHVILLTDGQSEPGDAARLVRLMSAARVTISAVAVGPDADRALLAQLAEGTGGRMYVTDTARAVPQIFVRETVLASRSGLYERQFTPTWQARPASPIVAGLRAADVPPLLGHVVTAAKPLAEVPLVRVSEDGADPILAHWQVGLGRTVAFTSGMWPRWGPDWVSWSGFSKFWTQAVRWAARPMNSTDWEAKITLDGTTARIMLDACAELGAARGAIVLEGQVVPPDFESQPLSLSQIGPGRFEGTFAALEPGSYIVRVAYRGGPGAPAGVVQAGLNVSYGAEWRDLRSNETLLADVARQTAGRPLHHDHPEAVFEPWAIRLLETRLPVWDLLLQLALGVFLADVAVRRLALSPAELARSMRQIVHELAGGRVSAAAAGTLATLKAARERSVDAALPTVVRSDRAMQELDDALRQPARLQRPVVAPPQSPEKRPVDSEDARARLLRAKKRVRGTLDSRDARPADSHDDET